MSFMENMRLDFSSGDPGERQEMIRVIMWNQTGAISAHAKQTLNAHEPAFHKDNDDIEELLEGEVTVSVLICEREHGVHE